MLNTVQTILFKIMCLVKLAIDQSGGVINPPIFNNEEYDELIAKSTYRYKDSNDFKEGLKILKNEFIKLNQSKTPTEPDMLFAVYEWDKLYSKIKSDKRFSHNNIQECSHYFVQEIFPLLINHKSTNTVKEHSKKLLTTRSNFCVAHLPPFTSNNHQHHKDPLLMSELIHTYLCETDWHWSKKMFLQRTIENIQKEYDVVERGAWVSIKALKPEERIAYIQTVLMPPASLAKKVGSEIIPKMKTLLLCLNHFYKEKKLSFKIPKFVIRNGIMTPLIKKSVPNKIIENADYLKNDIEKQITIMKKNAFSDGEHGATEFLYENFEKWSKDSMDPRKKILNTLWPISQNKLVTRKTQ
jgi:hypothetical protein